MMRQTASPVVPWFRQPLVWMVIAIPLSSVIMGVVIITASVMSYDGLVADDYYKRGLRINRVLDRDAAALRAGIEGSVEVTRGAVLLRLGSSTLALPDSLEMHLSYATRAGLDRVVALRRVGPDEYRGALDVLEPGRWYLEVGTANWRITGSLDPRRTRARLMARR